MSGMVGLRARDRDGGDPEMDPESALRPGGRLGPERVRVDATGNPAARRHAPSGARRPYRHASMSVRAIASGGGSTVSASSARVNQRTSSSSASRTWGSPPAYSAKKPSMSELGNGHGCDAM